MMMMMRWCLLDQVKKRINCRLSWFCLLEIFFSFVIEMPLYGKEKWESAAAYEDMEEIAEHMAELGLGI